MLTRIFVDNFRCLEKFELRPHLVNLIVGRNGSGKSTLLDALYAVARLVRGEAPSAVLPIDTLPWWDLTKLQTFELDVTDSEGAGKPFEYRLVIRRSVKEPPVIHEERLTHKGRRVFVFENGELGLAGLEKPFPYDGKRSVLALGIGSDAALREFQARLDGLLVFRLNPWAFELSAQAEAGMLWVNGANLVSVLRHWSQSSPEEFVRWKQRILGGMPHLDDLQLRELTPGARLLVGMKFVQGSETLLSLASMSDGERSLLALHAIAGLVTKGDVVALDEPDNFLSPAEVQPVLRLFTSDPLREFPPQVFVVTHHPRSIDYLASHATWLFERDANGMARVRQFEFDRADGERPADSILYEISP